MLMSECEFCVWLSKFLISLLFIIIVLQITKLRLDFVITVTDFSYLKMEFCWSNHVSCKCKHWTSV